jgi:DNA-binding response OmpR family regulator
MSLKPGCEAVIIMITAEDSKKTAIDALMKEGCDDYIVKPVKKDELISKLKNNRVIE